MTQPVNPNSDLPMSLKIDRIQHLRQIRAEQQQGQLARQAEQEAAVKKQRVIKNEQPARSRIREREQERREKKDSGRQEERAGEEERQDQGGKDRSGSEGDLDDRKGRFLDIKA